MRGHVEFEEADKGEQGRQVGRDEHLPEPERKKAYLDTFKPPEEKAITSEDGTETSDPLVVPDTDRGCVSHGETSTHA